MCNYLKRIFELWRPPGSHPLPISIKSVIALICRSTTLSFWLLGVNFLFLLFFLLPSIHCCLLFSRAPVTRMAETPSVTGSLLALSHRLMASVGQYCPLVALNTFYFFFSQRKHMLGNSVDHFESHSSQPVPFVLGVFGRSCVHLKPCWEGESNNKVEKCPQCLLTWIRNNSLLLDTLQFSKHLASSRACFSRYTVMVWGGTVMVGLQVNREKRY